MVTYPSSETQGQLVGTTECSWCKFTVRSSRAPGHSSSRSVISQEKQPGDSRVFLHGVVFLIDRHSCVERSMGKVSQGKFQNKMFTTQKNYKRYHGYKKQTLSDEFLRRIFRRYCRFLLLIRTIRVLQCTTFTFHTLTFAHIV